jgi:hypothetical protein
MTGRDRREETDLMRDLTIRQDKVVAEDLEDNQEVGDKITLYEY